MTDRSNALAVLLDAARRRHFLQVVIDQTGFAVAAVFAGSVLLLLLGTQILDWYWLVPLFLVSFGAGVWRTIRRIPSRYRLAQIIDSRLNLEDTLSTALAYESGSRSADSGVIEYQRHRAERLAAPLEARTVFPLHIPKTLYGAAGVALVACGMFALRYGVTRSLDLKPSLVQIAFDTFWKSDTRAAGEKAPLERRIEDQLKKIGINVGNPDAEAKQRDNLPESAMNNIDMPDAGKAEPGDNAQAKAKEAASDQQPGQGENAEKGSGSEDPNGTADPSTPTAQGAPQQGNQDAQKNGPNPGNNERSSLMDRMRDAMSNLLNKLKMQPKGSESRSQMAQDSKGGSRGQQSQSQKGNQGRSQSNGSDSPDQQSQEQAQGERSQTAQGHSGEKSGDHQASQDARSGIGKDDGDKSAKEAEQLAAMGKISEILGKRAQNMSGELMVEVAGGKQQLHTNYSGAVGPHAEAGGEINRDEVPLIYRNFVQQYFEQIRKTPAPASTKSKAAQAPVLRKPAKATE